ncbi:helix-turn-helix domain-containing protein [Xiamenia xianingshaonis]|uniref:Helix-turn-helix domain-containing protein n=1 Tax=Xiamenia xianingshaonis TaxID=2682776 RepID=A0ABX0IHS4_9ACTN|nr:helix-turn-helix domain-containing protein [Xiamenia xianingshaonis]NGM18110.1 helix-turn-helix domain-containing protein [Eggerthellaceae bacterium zg-893]NHM13587.1 helix-turn-helix domain-containing protein [Xiamenia xianingshaonis]
MIGQNILSLRTKQGMTQEELAQKVDVARQTVAKWESGDAIPDLDNACKISEVFDVSLDALVHHDEEHVGYPIPPRGLHLFGVVRMGERGQIVIPKRARDVFGLHAGSELLMLGDESQGIALQRVEDAVAQLERFGRAVNERVSADPE